MTETMTEARRRIDNWAIDANPQNNPTYPMEHRRIHEQRGYSWRRPPQQPVEVEVLSSVERPMISAVFGSSVPPSGLSGALRRFAYRFSESRYAHWLPLMLADRVNVVEGILGDLRRGRLPHPIRERGWGAYWKYDRQRVIRRGAVVAGVVVLALGLLALRSRRQDA